MVDSAAQRLIRQLIHCGKTLASAESCTGGLIGKLLTDVPGSSAAYVGGVISYTDQVKHQVLGVGQDTLTQFGAVSAPTAVAMAQGARAVTKADLAVSTTGLAGPDGDGSGKPVGLVYIAVADGISSIVRQYHFSGDRSAVRQQAALAAMALALAHLTGEKG